MKERTETSIKKLKDEVAIAYRDGRVKKYTNKVCKG